jgi:hypothetical protein
MGRFGLRNVASYQGVQSIFGFAGKAAPNLCVWDNGVDEQPSAQSTDDASMAAIWAIVDNGGPAGRLDWADVTA